MLARYPDKLSIDYQLTDESLTQAIPVLLLQPILENSIKYSIDHRETTKIKVVSSVDKEGLKIQIMDNGPGIKEGDFVVGTGLSSTITRLEKLYDGHDLFSIENLREEGAVVTINIPKSMPQ